MIPVLDQVSTSSPTTPEHDDQNCKSYGNKQFRYKKILENEIHVSFSVYFLILTAGKLPSNVFSLALLA